MWVTVKYILGVKFIWGGDGNGGGGGGAGGRQLRSVLPEYFLEFSKKTCIFMHFATCPKTSDFAQISSLFFSQILPFENPGTFYYIFIGLQ